MMLRPLTRADWAALRDLRLHALRTEPGVFTSTYERECAKTEDEWQALAEGDERHQLFGLFDGDQLAGITGAYAPHDEPEGVTVSFVMSYVSPEYRGRGVAGRFFHARIAWARAQARYSRARVWHRRSNERIARVIRRFGFRETAARAKTWNDGTVDELVECELELR